MTMVVWELSSYIPWVKNVEVADGAIVEALLLSNDADNGDECKAPGLRRS